MDFGIDSYDEDCNFDSGTSKVENDVLFSKNGRQKESEEYEYQVLTLEDVAEHQKNIISRVSSVLELSSTIVRVLLSHFEWDKDKLLEKYYDSDTEKFFKEFHLMNPFNKSSIPIRDKKPPSYPEACEICLSVLPPDAMTGLECGHRFCLSCWREYLSRKIVVEGVSQMITCPAHACDILVDDVTVINLLPWVKIKYQQLNINSFVACNKRLRWCSFVDCRYVIRVSERKPRPVLCKCGHVFCFFCGESWHDPIKCSWLQKWNKKCDEDSATSTWIAANTKECPRCYVTIEKDGGCNHMICKNSSCKYHFCWVCLGPWEPHESSWYDCNRFDDAVAKAARDEQQRQRATLAKYLHYFNRYANHRNSLKFEKKLYAMTERRMDELQYHNMSWIQVQFVKKAVDVLCQCRQTLMYTYAFAFYVEKNNQLEIFEGNQKDLELATEALSGYMERDITSEYLVDLNMEVQNKYRYCEKRRTALVDHVHEGYEKGWWDHIE